MVGAMKPKRCRQCKAAYMPTRPMQKACGFECALLLARSGREKKEAAAAVKERRETRERLKTRGDWLKDAQAAVNAYIRRRDSALPCISCGKFHEGQWHAGHYLSTGARPNLRFHEDNIHRQCVSCNLHLSGNLLNYRLGLIEKIGLERVEALECDHEPRKYTVDELKEIKSRYTRMRKEME